MATTSKRNFTEQKEPDFHQWDKIGSQVEGWLSTAELLESSEGGQMVKRYVRGDNGKLTGFLSGKGLEPKLTGLEGQYVRITFSELIETRNGEMKNFKIEIAD